MFIGDQEEQIYASRIMKEHYTMMKAFQTMWTGYAPHVLLWLVMCYSLGSTIKKGVVGWFSFIVGRSQQKTMYASGLGTVSGFSWILELKPEQKLDWAHKGFSPLFYQILSITPPFINFRLWNTSPFLGLHMKADTVHAKMWTWSTLKNYMKRGQTDR